MICLDPVDIFQLIINPLLCDFSESFLSYLFHLIPSLYSPILFLFYKRSLKVILILLDQYLSI